MMKPPLHPLVVGDDEDLFFQISFLNHSSHPLSIETIPEHEIFNDSPENEVKGFESLPPNFGGEIVIANGEEGMQKQQNEFPAKIAGASSKKWMHRETERQRRQEMTTLCASLRSTLPLEYIRGKRSASDHIDGAVKYINHLKNKVKQSKAKRDELMKSGHRISVIVHPYKGGVEIMCSFSFREYSFSQSTLLSILTKQGLNLVSYTSIKRDEMYIHTIQLEEPDMSKSATDYSELQRKLTEAVLCTKHREGAALSEPENC